MQKKKGLVVGAVEVEMSIGIWVGFVPGSPLKARSLKLGVEDEEGLSMSFNPKMMKLIVFKRVFSYVGKLRSSTFILEFSSTLLYLKGQPSERKENPASESLFI